MRVDTHIPCPSVRGVRLPTWFLYLTNKLLINFGCYFWRFSPWRRGMKYNIRRRSAYSTNPLMIQLQSKPRSRIELFNMVNPTFSVYIIVLCLENASKDTVTGLKLNSWYWQNSCIPDTGKVSGFWMSFVPGTHFSDKSQNDTRNWRQNLFLPWEKSKIHLLNIHIDLFPRYSTLKLVTNGMHTCPRYPACPVERCALCRRGIADQFWTSFCCLKKINPS